MRRWRRFRNRTVRIHTTNGTSLEGILVLVSRDFAVLKGAAELLTADQRADLDGETIVQLGQIDYWQAI